MSNVGPVILKSGKLDKIYQNAVTIVLLGINVYEAVDCQDPVNNKPIVANCYETHKYCT